MAQQTNNTVAAYMKSFADEREDVAEEAALTGIPFSDISNERLQATEEILPLENDLSENFTGNFANRRALSTVPIQGRIQAIWNHMSLDEKMATQGYSPMNDEFWGKIDKVSQDAIAERLRMNERGGPSFIDKAWYGVHKGFWGSVPAAIGTGVYSVGQLAYEKGGQNPFSAVGKTYKKTMDRHIDNIIRTHPGVAGFEDIEGSFGVPQVAELMTTIGMDIYGFTLPLAPHKLMKGKKMHDAIGAYAIGASGISAEAALANIQYQYLRRTEQGDYGGITELDLNEIGLWAAAGAAGGLLFTKFGRGAAQKQAARRALGEGLTADDVRNLSEDVNSAPANVRNNEDGVQILQGAEDAVAARNAGYGDDVDAWRAARDAEAQSSSGFWDDIIPPAGTVGEVRHAADEAANLERGFVDEGLQPGTGRIPVQAVAPDIGPTGSLGQVDAAREAAEELGGAGSASPLAGRTPYVEPGSMGQVRHAQDETEALSVGYREEGVGSTPYIAMQEMPRRQAAEERLAQAFEDAELTGQPPGRVVREQTEATTGRWFVNDAQLVAEAGRRIDGLRSGLRAMVEADNYDGAAELFNQMVGKEMGDERAKAAFVHLIRDSNTAEDFQKYLTNSEVSRLYGNLGSPKGSFLSKGNYDYEMGNWNRLPAGDYELLSMHGGQAYNVRKASRKGKWELYRNEGGPAQGPRIGQFTTLKAAKAAAEKDLANGFDIKPVSKAEAGSRGNQWGVYDAANGELVGLFKTKKQAVKHKDELAKNTRTDGVDSELRGDVDPAFKERGHATTGQLVLGTGVGAGAFINADHAQDWEGMLYGGLAGALAVLGGRAIWGGVASNRAQRLVDSGYVDARFAQLKEQGLSSDEAVEAVLKRKSLDDASTAEEMLYSLSDFGMGTINLMRNRMGHWGREFGDKMLNSYSEASRYTGMAMHKWNKHGRQVADKYGVKAHSMFGDTKEYAAIKNVAQKIMRKSKVEADTPKWMLRAGMELAAGWSKQLDTVIDDAVKRGFYTPKQAADLRAWVAKEGYLPRIWDTAYLTSRQGRERFAAVLTGQGRMKEMAARNIMMNILDGDEARISSVMRHMINEEDGTMRFTEKAATELLSQRNFLSVSANPAKSNFLEKKRRILFKDELFEEFILNDPQKIAATYFESLGNRFAFANNFGKNGEEATRLAGLISEVEGPEFGQSALEMFRRAVNDVQSETVQAKFMINGKGGSPVFRSIIDSVDAFETQKLGFAQILNLTQALAYSATLHVGSKGFGGLIDYMKDVSTIIGKMGTGELQDVVEMSGAALNTTLRQYATEQSLASSSIGGLRFAHKASDGVGTSVMKGVGNFFTDPNAFLKGTGFLQAEEFNRKLGANLGYLQAQRMQNKVLSLKLDGKKIPYWMQKQADDLGLDLRYADQWTDDDLLTAALRWSDIVNFTNRSGDLPLWWQTHDPLTRLMRKFKTFGFHSAVFLKDNIFYPLMTGKVDPNDPIADSHLFSAGRNVNRVKAALSGATYAGVAGTLLGVPASYVREFMRTADVDTDMPMLERWLKGVMSIGGAGIFLDMVASDTKLRDMAGPGINDLIAVMDNWDQPAKLGKKIVNYPDYIEEAVFGK